MYFCFSQFSFRPRFYAVSSYFNVCICTCAQCDHVSWCARIMQIHISMNAEVKVCQWQNMLYVHHIHTLVCRVIKRNYEQHLYGHTFIPTDIRFCANECPINLYHTVLVIGWLSLDIRKFVLFLVLEHIRLGHCSRREIGARNASCLPIHVIKLNLYGKSSHLRRMQDRAADRGHNVRHLSIRPSISLSGDKTVYVCTLLVIVTFIYVSQGTRTFPGMLPFWFYVTELCNKNLEVVLWTIPIIKFVIFKC